jgi:hypothetical protein
MEIKVKGMSVRDGMLPVLAEPVPSQILIGPDSLVI